MSGFIVLALMLVAALIACYITAVIEADVPVGTSDLSDHDVAEFAAAYRTYHNSRQFGR